ncbi:MAG: hypothetical protein ACOC8K_04025, partial [Gemmatimonadota bacterium]
MAAWAAADSVAPGSAHAMDARFQDPPAQVASAQEAAAPDAQVTVYRVPVTGTIELGLAPFIARSLREAEERGAAAVIL